MAGGDKKRHPLLQGDEYYEKEGKIYKDVIGLDPEVYIDPKTGKRMFKTWLGTSPDPEDPSEVEEAGKRLQEREGKVDFSQRGLWSRLTNPSAGARTLSEAAWVAKQKRQAHEAIGGPQDPGASTTISMPLPAAQLPEPSQQGGPTAPYKVSLGSGSTRRIMYGDRHLPTELLNDLNAREENLREIYGKAGESLTSQAIEERREATIKQAMSRFGMTRPEVLNAIENGEVPDAFGGFVGEQLKFKKEAVRIREEYNKSLKAAIGQIDLPGLKDRLAMADAEVKRAYEEIKNAKIDPMANVPMWAVALIGIGAGLQNIGKAGAGNATVNVMNSVINAEKERQKIQLQKKMDLYKLASNQRAYLSNLFEQRFEAKARLQKSYMVHELAKVAAQEKTLGVKLAATDSIISLGASLREDELKARSTAADKMAAAEKYTIDTKLRAAPIRTSQWQQRLVVPKAPKGAGTETPPPKMIDKFNEGQQSLEFVKTVKNKLKGLSSYGVIDRHLPNSSAQRIRDVYLRPLAVSLRKARETGVMTEPDYQRYKAITDRRFVSRKELIGRINWIMSDMIRKQMVTLNTYKDYYNVRPLQRQLLRYYPTVQKTESKRAAEKRKK